jgi:hypothetical protein
MSQWKVTYKVIEFKSFPYYWDRTREGKKPFDLRLVDFKDSRFQALSRWRRNFKRWLICLVNTGTGERLYFKIAEVRWHEPSDLWVTIMLGEEIKEE